MDQEDDDLTTLTNGHCLSHHQKAQDRQNCKKQTSDVISDLQQPVGLRSTYALYRPNEQCTYAALVINTLNSSTNHPELTLSCEIMLCSF